MSSKKIFRKCPVSGTSSSKTGVKSKLLYQEENKILTWSLTVRLLPSAVSKDRF